MMTRSFLPLALLTATTHFKIVSAAVEVNFDEGTYVKSEKDSGVLPYDNNTFGIISLASTLSTNSTNPVFIVLGVRFYTDVNGVQYPLKDAVHNGLTIVKVNAA